MNRALFERVDSLYRKRSSLGLTPEQADSVVRRFSVHSNIPEPIRVLTPEQTPALIREQHRIPVLVPIMAAEKVALVIQRAMYCCLMICRP